MTCGADVPFARTARLLEMAGGSAVSATTAMNSLRRAGEAVAETERSAARDLYRDGVPPEADSFAEEVLVEADGTYVRMRDGSAAEVKAVVAYAGKERGGGRARRVEPVRLGCVGEAPGVFWEQAVAQIGRRFDLARVERVHLGTDGEAQYVNGLASMRFPEAAGHIDPFHVARAVASCAVDRAAGGAALADAVRSLGPEACADLIDDMIEDGTAREGSEAVAAYLRRHAAEIGGGPLHGHDGGRAAAHVQGAHGVVPVRVVARGRGRHGEGQELALLRVRAAGAHARGVALAAPGGPQGREARELRGVQAGDQAKIRGEGVGVPRLRLPRRDGLRREVQVQLRGAPANNSFTPTNKGRPDLSRSSCGRVSATATPIAYERRGTYAGGHLSQLRPGALARRSAAGEGLSFCERDAGHGTHLDRFPRASAP